MKKTIWHSLVFKRAVDYFNSDIKKGFSEKEVKKRKKRFGLNKLPEEKPFSSFKILLEQFKSPLIYILVIAGVITLILNEYTDSIVIFGAVALNTIVGYFQENKASKALKALKRAVEYRTRIIRSGNIKLINSEEIVPGDIFILRSGDRVPADGRIIESKNLKINEMALTGEWLPAKKFNKPLNRETPLADRDNMVYMGTIVEDGRAKVVAVATGSATEIGQVAELVRETKEEKTPLQKKLAHFARIVGLIILAITTIIFIEGIITGNSFLEMFLIAVAVAVAAIPEGLPVAMTVILALGMQRILKKKGLVRKLLAAETLGSTSIIATDKTATLTEGKMKVSEILTVQKILKNRKDKKTNSLILEIAVLLNEAFVENPQDSLEKWVVQGRPTDKALLLSGVEAGIDRNKLKKEMKIIEESPFNSINKFAFAVYQKEKEKLLYALGAPEKILDFSKFIEIKGKKQKITKKQKEKIKKVLDSLTGKGLRIISVAYKKSSDLKNKMEDLTFLGLVVLKDPLRKDIKEAIRICRQAGMRPIIVTGDHRLTAKAIAEEIGFKIKKGNIVEGKDLDKMTDKEFEEKIKNIKIYARVEPRHKMKIIEAWQEKGEIVAMTGDGINDAPALKRADIGVALGSGTDVAKEVGDLILLPDSFNILVAAVEEGRAILDNIRKVITYLLSDSFSEVILIGGALLFGYPLPLLPAQILWVNLIEDGLPNMALAFEPKEKDLMNRKPIGRKSPLLTREMKAIIFIIGVITDLILLGLFFLLLSKTNNIVYIRTMIFSVLTIDSLFYVFSCKSLRRNLWHINPFSNKFLIGAWAIGILMLVLAIYVPLFQTILKTVPLAFTDWLIILFLGLIELILIEFTKYHFITTKQDTN